MAIGITRSVVRAEIRSRHRHRRRSPRETIPDRHALPPSVLDEPDAEEQDVGGDDGEGGAGAGEDAANEKEEEEEEAPFDEKI